MSFKPGKEGKEGKEGTTRESLDYNPRQTSGVERTMKTRAEHGYALDANKNRMLLLQSHFPHSMQLFRTWTWLERTLRLKRREGALSGDKSLATHLLGFQHNDLEMLVSRLTDQKRWTEAALLLALETRKWDKVLELLMLADNETRLVATTLSALSFPLTRAKTVSLPSRELEWIVGLMANFVAPEIPISLRAAYLFDTDENASIALDKDIDRAIESGDLDVLPLLGCVDDRWKTVVRNYAKTGDIQSAALISTTLSFLTADAPEFLEAYRDALDGWGLQLLRCLLDVEYATLARKHQRPIAVPPSVILRCTFCSATLQNSASCPACKNAVPRCVMCGVGVMAGKREGGCIVWCTRCKHGGHAGCLRMWFREGRGCPVSGCNCACLDSS